MGQPERLQYFQEKMSRLRQETKELSGDRFNGASELIRAAWVQTPDSKNKDPKLLGIETEMLDIVVKPILDAATLIMEENPSLGKRFSKDQKTWEGNSLKLIGGCLNIIEQEGRLTMDKVEEVIEQVVS